VEETCVRALLHHPVVLSDQIVVILVYIPAFAIALHVFLSGRHVLAYAVIVAVWALLALWLVRR
jgi:energy-converting hydrogenase Eha subunit E